MSAVVRLLSLYTIISWTATVYCYTLSFRPTACSASKSCATFDFILSHVTRVIATSGG